MFLSKSFIPTLKEVPQDAESISHQLMLRAGLMRQLVSGVYSYLPAGVRVLHNIEQIIRQEMNACSAQELLLSALQPHDLWVRSGRDKEMGQVMFRFDDRRGRKMCLGPTHEEIITDLVKDNVFSYRQLPLLLYQIQVKFRDEIRPRFGLVRSCEFIMKDAYSFDKDEEGLKQNYAKMLEAYKRIFARCGLDCLVIEADPGVMGGSVSHEFMVPSESGEDTVSRCVACGFATSESESTPKCPKCSKALQKINAVEIGHIFQLGTKYSASLGAKILNQDGKQIPVIMGCYGIGVSRLIPAVIEQNHDKDGIIWPNEVTPFEGIVLPLEVENKQIYQVSLDVYNKLQGQGVEVLFDDREERAGVKFKDADLMGLPFQVILGKKFLQDGNVELKMRRSKKSLYVAPDDVSQSIKQELDSLS